MSVAMMAAQCRHCHPTPPCAVSAWKAVTGRNVSANVAGGGDVKEHVREGRATQ